MKGVVFRALMGVVEEQFGPVVVEEMLDDANLARHGAYTTVGDYPVEEFYTLVQSLQRVSGASQADILRECGRRTIAYFIATQSKDEGEGLGLEKMLASLQGLIHANYVKLYPDSVVPSLQVQEAKDGWVVVEYRSPRPMADLAEGMVLGTLDHLGIDTQVQRTDLPPKDGRAAQFRVALPES